MCQVTSQFVFTSSKNIHVQVGLFGSQPVFPCLVVGINWMLSSSDNSCGDQKIRIREKKREHKS